MGGHAAGEVASRIAAETVVELAGRPVVQVRDIVAQVGEANRRILASAARHPEQTGMGTTVAGLALVSVGGSRHWAVFNIGDSRVYRCLDGAALARSPSTTRRCGSSSSGASSPRSRRSGTPGATSSPARSDATRWASSTRGSSRPTRARSSSSAPTACPTSSPARRCEAVLADHPDAEEAAAELVRRGVAAGGRDNVTAIVVAVQGAGRRLRRRRGHHPARERERLIRGEQVVDVSGPSVVVERAPDGWTHIGGPGMHLLIGLDEDDERTIAASDAADGGDIDDVVEVLTAGGMRKAHHFVGVHWQPRTRIVAFGPVVGRRDPGRRHRARRPRDEQQGLDRPRAARRTPTVSCCACSRSPSAPQPAPPLALGAGAGAVSAGPGHTSVARPRPGARRRRDRRPGSPARPRRVGGAARWPEPDARGPAGRR